MRFHASANPALVPGFLLAEIGPQKSIPGPELLRNGGLISHSDRFLLPILNVPKKMPKRILALSAIALIASCTNTPSPELMSMPGVKTRVVNDGYGTIVFDSVDFERSPDSKEETLSACMSKSISRPEGAPVSDKSGVQLSGVESAERQGYDMPFRYTLVASYGSPARYHFDRIQHAQDGAYGRPLGAAKVYTPVNVYRALESVVDRIEICKKTAQ